MSNDISNPGNTPPSGGSPAKWVAAGAAGAVVVALAAVGATRMLPSASSQGATQTTANADAGLPPPPPKAGSAATSNGSAVKHSAPRAATLAQAAPARPAINPNVGTVESVVAVKHKGQGTGLGAVAGGILGGVVGHQFGGGTGKDVMTVAGAVGGGLAGNEIEKNARATTVYDVRIRMEDGSVRTVQRATAPAVGTRVTYENGQARFGG